jgi:hypothetical protein
MPRLKASDNHHADIWPKRLAAMRWLIANC